MKVQISPSILASDITKLREQIELVENADWVHVDVMDNHFVPNLTWGKPVADACVGLGVLPVDVHLMIENPDLWAPQYAASGADNVTFHAEAAIAPLTTARRIRQAGAKAGIAFRPTTDVTPYLDFLDEFDQILIMTVEPGFGGQRFLNGMMSRVAQVRAAIDKSGLDVHLQVDGGIDRNTIGIAAKAGANIFVAGSSIYGSADPRQEVVELRNLAAGAIS